MSYLELLEHSYKTLKELDMADSRLEYLSDYIFDFTTYDGEISELFALKALEVCLSITNNKTFDYHRASEENYRWYLVMCNMPFFQNKLDWGGSIRGAWWDTHKEDTFSITSCGFWKDDEQIIEPLKFNIDQWNMFIKDMVKFSIKKEF